MSVTFGNVNDNVAVVTAVIYGIFYKIAEYSAKLIGVSVQRDAGITVYIDGLVHFLQYRVKVIDKLCQ